MNDFALQLGEIRTLFDVCSADEGAAGPHDAAAFALLFGTGLRRTEAVGVQLEDYDAVSRALTITGKGNRRGKRGKKRAAEMLAAPFAMKHWKTAVRDPRRVAGA